MKIEKLMSKDVKTCSPNASLAEAAHLMWQRDCGCIPVADGNDRIVGMITDRDICMAAYFKGKPLHEISVAESMSRQVIACRSDDAVAAAEEVMMKAQVRRLPVLDASGRLVGILSLNDIARAATRDRTARAPEIGLHDVALTLGAVCAPHSASAV